MLVWEKQLNGKSGYLDTTGKDSLPRISPVFPQPQGILDCFDCCVYFVLPISSALSGAAEHLGQIVVSRRGKTVLFILFFFFSWQTTFQDGGEEVEDGAVYNVTLKKVQIQQAANKGARWLGVSEASRGNWGGLLMDFGAVSRQLNSTGIVTILTFSTSNYLKKKKKRQTKH